MVYLTRSNQCLSALSQPTPLPCVMHPMLFFALSLILCFPSPRPSCNAAHLSYGLWGISYCTHAFLESKKLGPGREGRHVVGQALMAVMWNTAPEGASAGGRIEAGTEVPQGAVVARSSPVIPALGHPSPLHTGRVLLALPMPFRVARALSLPRALQVATLLVLGNCDLQFRVSGQPASTVSAVGQRAVVPGKEAEHFPLVQHHSLPSGQSSRPERRSRALVPGHPRLPLS